MNQIQTKAGLVTLVPTSEKIVSENYPYGFTLKTTKTDWIEFKKGKGFRHVSQTVNPKNGKLNAEKKSTYYDLMVLGTLENGHVTSIVRDTNGNEATNNACDFMAANFALFTAEQIQNIAANIANGYKVSWQCQVQYCGSNVEELKPFYLPLIQKAIHILKTGENLFSECKIDVEAVNAFKVEGFNPFKVTTYVTN